MKKRMTGKVSHTRKAPSRFSLEMFGGTMSIEEFRGGKPCVVKIPGEFYQEHLITKQDVPVGGGGGELRLKREKPLERTKGKLETSLGIIRKCPHQQQPVVASLVGGKSQNKTKV